jgi:glyoxylase-like metal-dependent hydrolase (beta-lactamase superfamily II)
MGLFLAESKLFITGDAVKNRPDFVRDILPPCFGDREDAIASLHKVKTMAKRILPGHDVPFTSCGQDKTVLDSPRSSIVLRVNDRLQQSDRRVSIFSPNE